MKRAEHPCIARWDEHRAFHHERGMKMPFVDETSGARQLRMHVSVINPGEAPHPPHAHAGEEIIYITELKKPGNRAKSSVYDGRGMVSFPLSVLEEHL